MNVFARIATLAILVAPQIVMAQADTADFRIRADFNIPQNAPWGANESVGGPDFRIHSRFLQVYYGGVSRHDDFKFSVQFDFRGISGFSTSFATSPYNHDFDVYINNGFVGRVHMNAVSLGLGKLEYESRNPTPPSLPIPAGFPDPVNTFDIVRAFAAAATLPAIGAALPGGAPLFSGELVEQFARGDVNQDGKVDLLDFAFLTSNYDPFHATGLHVGPRRGDFTGDNRCDLADYTVMAANWTDHHNLVPPPPAPIAPCPADFNGDHNADFFDYLDFVNAFSLGLPAADFNHDAVIDFFDYLDFVEAFSIGC